MILYALKDKNTEWYVTRNGQFDELCADTCLFKREVDAERCLRFSIDGFTLLSPMIRSLVRSLLEKKYKKPFKTQKRTQRNWKTRGGSKRSFGSFKSY